MDIAALSMYMSQSSASSAAGIALLKKTLDSTTENSQALIKAMELSANPNLGSKIDVRA